ncbi:MAG: hypothetical protein P1V81_09745 [Planctomycetota bacterium]|nr:hypothetical protein [Planctomycetota bacterium]
MLDIPKLALLTLAAFPLAALAQDGTSGGPCMQLEAVVSATKSTYVIDCTCAGGTVVGGGWVDLPGVSGGGSYEAPKGLLCESFIVLAGYDTPVPGGTTTVEWVKDVFDQLYLSDCDTSGCGRFLGFLWSVGGSHCSLGAPIPMGSHGHYKLTGEHCVEGGEPPIPSVTAGATFQGAGA